jgi:SAM-dependent methyltransferase
VNVARLRDLIAKAGRDVRGPPTSAGRPASEVTGATPTTPYLDWLREGRIGDDGFDDVYPMHVRAISSTFWTPVRVAVRASQLLVRDAATRVLDVGSGAGKFCIVGAATTGAQFVGIEHRVHLVETARSAAARVGVTNAQFVHGTFDAMDSAMFDAIYLYNPFEENVWDRKSCIDEAVELSRGRFLADVERAEGFLAAARVGTRVVTYHGFGGEMPPAYRLALTERCHSGQLDLWIREGDPMSVGGGTSARRCDAPSTEGPSSRDGSLPRTSVESAKRGTCPPELTRSFIASQDPPADIPHRASSRTDKATMTSKRLPDSFWCDPETAILFLEADGWTIARDRAQRGEASIPAPQVGSRYNLRDLCFEDSVGGTEMLVRIRAWSGRTEACGGPDDIG